jgi:hypothetical protein
VWGGTAWVAVDEKTKLHVFFVRLYVFRFMLEQPAVAVVSNVGQ